MNEKKFSEQQIKILISSLLYIAKKNNGFIPIQSLEEAAEVVAYSTGFNSFKELKKSLRQDSFSLENSNLVNTQDLLVDKKELLLSNKKELLNDILISKKELKVDLPKKPLIDTDDSIRMLNQKDDYQIVVGSTYDNINKCEIIKYLNKENTIFIGENKKFFDLSIEKVIKRNISHLHITNINASQTELINNDDVKLINIDPLNEIYCSDYFDILFGLDYTDFNSFDVLWSMIIKDFISSNDYTMNSKFLKYSLSLEFLLLYFVKLKSNKNPLSNLLERYFKDLEVDLKNNGLINISNESIEKHLEKIAPIYNKVKIIDDLYNKNIFKVNKRDSIISLLKNRTSVQLQLKESNNTYINHIYDTLIRFILNSYEDVCEKNNYKKENYQLAVIVDVKNLVNNKFFYKNQYSYIIKYLEQANESLNHVEQIVFGQQKNILKFDNDFLVNFYTNTDNIVNIFAFKNKKLSELKINQSYLWKKDLDNNYLDVFNLDLISLSNVQIIQ